MKNIHNLSTYLLIATIILLNSSILKASPPDSTLKSNPIIFAEVFFGFSGGRAGGWSLGAEQSYHIENNLFSVRYVGSAKFNNKGFASPFVPIPIIEGEATSEEFSILYGYRKIIDGDAFSIIGGISRNKYTFYGNYENNTYKRDYYIGFPIELNYQFFKREKKRIYIYGIIPVGKPTGIGQGLGIKLIGNISRNPYLGLALNGGFGYFKKY